MNCWCGTNWPNAVKLPRRTGGNWPKLLLRDQSLMEELTAPRLPEAGWFESGCHGWMLQHGVVALLSFGRRYVADGLQEPPVVEPVHPFQRRELDGFERPPRPTSMDDLSFVETIDRLGESIVDVCRHQSAGRHAHSRLTGRSATLCRSARPHTLSDDRR